jgi:endonuclease-8
MHDVGIDTRRELFVTAARLLRANLGSPRRTTVPGGLAVYDRAGRACPRCGGAIETRRLGEQARSVWWCPGCQR